ncbi:MAG: hypothetical protein IJN68_00175 [Clostridia bacterium]|nr:hypothetical protein [Clostridia bacterium]
MFLIYGSKDILEDDSWFGNMDCPNCGSDQKHMFKLLKRYPTLFFVKLPLGRVVKRYLLCTNCGANRVVKKKEYEYIKTEYSKLAQNIIPINKPIAAEKSAVNTESQVSASSEAVEKIPDKPSITENNASEVKSEGLVSEKKPSNVSVKQRIVENKVRVSVKKKESEEVIASLEIAAEPPNSEREPVAEPSLTEKKLIVIDGKPHAVNKELPQMQGKNSDDAGKIVASEKSGERNHAFEFIAIGIIVALLVGVLSVSVKFFPDKTTEGKQTTTTTTTVKQTTSAASQTASVPFSKGYVDGNKYYNNWLNIAFELPENYTEADESFYDLLESQSTDEYGMYFVSDKSEYVAIGFADFSSDPYVTAEEFVEAAAEITKEQFSEYGNVYTDSVLDVTIAGKKFKYIDVFVGENAVLSIFAYKIDNRMCYMNVLGRSWSDNFDLVFSIGKMY